MLIKKQGQAIKKIAKKMKINTIYLFGSRAKGGAYFDSDYDFAVQFSKEVKERKYFDLKLKLMSEFSRIAGNDRIDIVVLNQKIPLALKFRVIKEGKILYVNDDMERSRLEEKIMSNYLDRQYYFKRYINTSLKNIAERGIL